MCTVFIFVSLSYSVSHVRLSYVIKGFTYLLSCYSCKCILASQVDGKYRGTIVVKAKTSCKLDKCRLQVRYVDTR